MKKSYGYVMVSTLLLCALMFSFLPQVSADLKPLSGELMLHDPTLIKEGNTWYAYGTGEIGKNGIRVLTSTDGLHWSEAPGVLTTPLSWWSNYVPNAESNQWAPDVSYYNGKYYMLYSVSSFGSNTSLIGMLSTTSLSSNQWQDEGLVIRSTGNNNYNAIDGDLVIDANGDPWLSFGSFWSGIKLTRLNNHTLKPTGQLYSIAERTNHPQKAIEAPAITYHNGYYYLFVSFDSCCQGSNSTYKIAVGRSSNITGPYVDKNGTSMMQGGGTIIESNFGQFVGPGGQDIYENNLIIRHAYDTTQNGLPQMLISDLYWDVQGWPTLTPPSQNAPIQNGIYKIKNRASGLLVDVNGKSTADGAAIIQYADNGGDNQKWHVTHTGNGIYKIISVHSGKALEIYEWSTLNGAIAVQYTDFGGANQLWRLEALGNGHTKATNLHSNKALDGYGTSNGSPVIQYDYHGGNNQQWEFIKVN